MLIRLNMETRKQIAFASIHLISKYFYAVLTSIQLCKLYCSYSFEADFFQKYLNTGYTDDRSIEI